MRDIKIYIFALLEGVRFIHFKGEGEMEKHNVFLIKVKNYTCLPYTLCMLQMSAEGGAKPPEATETKPVLTPTTGTPSSTVTTTQSATPSVTTPKSSSQPLVIIIDIKDIFSLYNISLYCYSFSNQVLFDYKMQIICSDFAASFRDLITH